MKKKGLKIFGKYEILRSAEISIYTRIMKCQMNGNYCAKGKILKFPQIKFNKILKKETKNKKK